MSNVRVQFSSGLILCLVLATGPTWAQSPTETTGGREAGGTAYYTFARPGQNTIEVIVLGGGQSGIYKVGENVNMGQLMALAGGGGSGGRTNVTVHHFRLENGRRNKILEEDLDDFAERSVYPSLQDGDVVRIEANESFGWRDGLQILTPLLSLATTLLTVFDVGR